MKLGNLALTVIAGGLIAATTVTLGQATASTPTSVLSVPLAGARGGGLTVLAPTTLTLPQAELLALAYDIARRDGHRYPQVLQAIILQETKAGALPTYKVAGQEHGLKPNQRYYGVAQVKLATARDVLGRYPALWQEFKFHTRTDEEVIAKLIDDPRFNLTVASRYLLLLQAQGHNTVKQLATAYNLGAAGARAVDQDQHQYTVKVMQHLQDLQQARGARRDG